MTQLAIRFVLPTLIAAIPALVGLLIFAAIPPDARRDYLDRVAHSPFDWIILGLGLVLFVMQFVLAWQALRWQNTGFNQRPDQWLSHLAQAAEWFPLLGLLGTVAAILHTFGSIVPGSSPTSQEIIRKISPAITTTGSGLFMALMNILPVWVVVAGRDLIRTTLLPVVPLQAAATQEPRR